MNKKLLSSMSRIYKLSGIEPEWWANGVSTCYGVEDLTKRTDLYDTQHMESYYPESQLWEMLPDVVMSNGDDKEAEPSEWRLVIERDCEHGVKYITEAYGNTYDLVVKKADNNLHTALVDMVLWCLENGYIKGEKQ